ncbi:unnamed protein product [marine sediment metagenome]|uniref:Uncharacterized protein n=1 Tax=marine sediment metagenome TaxID=412755 RepID=X1CMK2_9ZZZZ
MVLRYSKLFTFTCAISHDPVTVLVESIEGLDGRKIVSIKTLEGEYGSARDFEQSIDYTIGRWERGDISTRKEVKLWTLLSFMQPETSQLVDALNEAIVASEAG